MLLLLLFKSRQMGQGCFGSFPNFCYPERRSGRNRISHPDWVKLCVELNYAPNQNTKIPIKAHQTISSSEPFRAGRTYFLSAPFIAAEAQHHEESRLIYEPFESTFLDQEFPVEHELHAFNPPLIGTPLYRL